MTRNTLQRALVLETVTNLKNHPTADEVYSKIAVAHKNISRATVYRNLNQLAKSGTISKVSIPNGADCFDHTISHHYHVKCSACNKVFDVEMEYMEGLESKIKNTEGFKFNSHTIVFSGCCPKCQKSN